jgi:hypothetical protein
MKAKELADGLRRAATPIAVRIVDAAVVVDLRTVSAEQDADVTTSLLALV